MSNEKVVETLFVRTAEQKPELALVTDTLRPAHRTRQKECRNVP